MYCQAYPLDNRGAYGKAGTLKARNLYLYAETMKAAKYTKDFLEFWKAYPKRWNRDSGVYYKVGKWEAFQAWKRISQKDRDNILVKVKYMKNGEFVLDAHRWLKKRRFDDIEIPKPRPRLVIEKRIEPKQSPASIEAREKLRKAFAAMLAKRKAPVEVISDQEFGEKRNKTLKNLNALKNR